MVSGSSLYPRVRNWKAFCTRSGVRSRPSRCGSSPRRTIISRTRSSKLAVNAIVHVSQVADHAAFIYLARQRDLQYVVVAVPVRVIALAIDSAVLGLGHCIAVQAM